MSTRFALVDAFASGPFRGNPAAVCLLEHPADDEWMQTLAHEFGYSETAYLAARAQDGFDLRWFTPATEVDLCGHATLASAHALWTLWDDRRRTLEFHTASGVLTAERKDEEGELDFPVSSITASDAGDVAHHLGAEPVGVYRTHYDLLIELAHAHEVRGLQPNGIAHIPARGVIVTAASDDPAFDFISRFFAPQSGIDEDPVTGSAHCALAPFWAARTGKTDMIGYQASQRGGIVRVGLRGDRVKLGGRCETIASGELGITPVRATTA